MTISISQIRTNVYDILSSCTSVPVIRQDQSETPPAETYAAYRFKYWEQQGNSSSEYTGGSATEYTVTSLWKVCMEVAVVGKDSEQSAIQIAQRLNRSTIQYMFEVAGMPYLSQTEIKSFPKLLAFPTDWQERFILNVYFNLTLTDIDSVNFWEFLEITTTVKDVTDITVVSDTQVVDIIP